MAQGRSAAVVVNALAKAGIELGENGSIFPRPKGKPPRGLLTHTRNLLRRAKFWLNGNCAPATLKDNLGPTTLKCPGTETWEHRTMRPSLARTRQG